MNAKAGVREDDEKRRAYRQAISENQRLREESLAQYAIRRQKDFRNAANYGVVIPNSLKAMLLKEGAGLSDQNQQNLTALLQGNDEDPDLVARCLSRMDVRSDRLSAYVDDAAREPSYLADTDATSEDDDVFENEEVLQELDKMELNEDQICEGFRRLGAQEIMEGEQALQSGHSKRPRQLHQGWHQWLSPWSSWRAPCWRRSWQKSFPPGVQS